MKSKLEYIWLDGFKPTQTMRSKTLVVSDFDGTGGNLVDGLDDVTKFPALTYALLEHGYSHEEVKKILGENFLRVFKKVCR